MNKLILAAAAIASLGLGALAAAPTLAAQGVPYCGATDQDVNDNVDQISALLKEQGVNASDISVWNGCIKAFVTKSDGKVATEFFDPDSLKQVGLTAGA